MFKLGRFLGIDVSLHWTLLLLVVWSASSSPLGFAASALLTLAIFGCVLLHEFGHALAARQFGIDTAGIALYPIGGVATLERMPRNPKQELWIAVAGPLVNVVIAAVLIAVSPLVGMALGGTTLLAWMSYLAFANIALVLFNLLPAFPMDGGRILRSLAAMYMPYADATSMAARIGRWMALAFAILGIAYGHLMLIVIAGFIVLAGTAEAREASRPEFGMSHPRYASTESRGVARGSKAFRLDTDHHWIRTIKDGRIVTAAWDPRSSVYRIVASQ